MSTHGDAPTVQPRPGASASRRRMGKREKILLSCALGCGGLILLVLIAGVGGFFWVLSPGDQVETAAVVSPESVGAVQLHRTLEDPGVAALSRNLIQEIQAAGQRQRAGEAPSALRWMEQFQGNPEQGLSWWVPKDVTVSLEPGPGQGEPSWVLALNPRAFPRVVRTMIALANKQEGSDQEAEIPYKDFTIQRLGSSEPTFLAFHGGTLLVSDGLTAIQGALDRAAAEAAGEPSRATPEVAGKLALDADFAERWDATAVLANEEDRVGEDLREWMIDKLPTAEEPPPTDGIYGLAAGVDVRTADEIQLEVVLGFLPAAEEARRQWREYLETALDPERWLEADASVEPRLEMVEVDGEPGGRLVARVTFVGLERWARRLAMSLEGHSIEVTGDSGQGIDVEVE